MGYPGQAMPQFQESDRNHLHPGYPGSVSRSATWAGEANPSGQVHVRQFARPAIDGGFGQTGSFNSSGTGSFNSFGSSNSFGEQTPSFYQEPAHSASRYSLDEKDEKPSGVMAMLADPHTRRAWLKKHQSTLVNVSFFFVMCYVVWHLFSDNDFSFLLTMASKLSLLSFIMVAVKVSSVKSCAGISLRMMECYFVVFTARLCSILPYDGYLPYDSTGDHVYRILEVCCCALAAFMVYQCRVTYKATYDPAADILNPLYLIVPSLVLAVLFHPSLNQYAPADICWVAALYLETVTVLPQLFMFQKQGRVDEVTTHFLAAQAMSKLCNFVFWASSYHELANHSAGGIKSWVGIWVLIFQILQLVLMGDFIYQYIKCLRQGIPVTMIISESV